MKADSIKSKNIAQPQNQPMHYDSFVQNTDSSTRTVEFPKDEISVDLKDLDDKINTMISKKIIW